MKDLIILVITNASEVNLHWHFLMSKMKGENMDSSDSNSDTSNNNSKTKESFIMANNLQINI